jgi:RsiW-degrading membrane proteinase PrsW (M82 family)
MPLVPVNLLAFLGGVLPALIWLFFWLMEDRCEPEPKRYILFSFLLGMVAVVPALYFEQLASTFLPMSLGLLLVWAFVEEITKYGAAYLGALRSSAFDEPIDAVIYLATAALGFSAAENILFLWKPLAEHDYLRSIIMGDLRFMGASLLHIVASVTIGLGLALSYHKPRATRFLYALLSVILAVALHTIFNFFIIQGTSEIVWIFMCVWIGVIAALLMTERVKEPKDYC